MGGSKVGAVFCCCFIRFAVKILQLEPSSLVVVRLSSELVLESTSMKTFSGSVGVVGAAEAAASVQASKLVDQLFFIANDWNSERMCGADGTPSCTSAAIVERA